MFRNDVIFMKITVYRQEKDIALFYLKISSCKYVQVKKGEKFFISYNCKIIIKEYYITIS